MYCNTAGRNEIKIEEKLSNFFTVLSYTHHCQSKRTTSWPIKIAWRRRYRKAGEKKAKEE
jgi:hypothetical protein